jgi:hypothetical protein
LEALDWILADRLNILAETKKKMKGKRYGKIFQGFQSGSVQGEGFWIMTEDFFPEHLG